MDLTPTLTLNNNLTMPQIGLGVWQIEDGAEVKRAVSTALEAGYRLIDTAAIYGNEQGVGQAIAESGLERDSLFITTKVWNDDQGYESTMRAFETSLKKLGLEYLDLYLIHWPAPHKGRYVETWQALEELYEQGRIKAIGVSNFQPVHLEELARHSSIVPAVNQIELHPTFTQEETVAYCQEHNIKIESWSPIGGSGGDLLSNPVLAELSTIYHKTPAQIVIKWHLQKGFIVIPKSSKPERIKENIDVFDFELTFDDMNTISGLNTNQRRGADPATATF